MHSSILLTYCLKLFKYNNNSLTATLTAWGIRRLFYDDDIADSYSSLS